MEFRIFGAFLSYWHFFNFLKLGFEVILDSNKGPSHVPFTRPRAPVVMSYTIIEQYQSQEIWHWNSVCIGLCHFITCVDSYNHHHNQDWQLFSHRKDLFCATPPKPFPSHHQWQTLGFFPSVILRSLWVAACINSFSSLCMETGGGLTWWKGACFMTWDVEF